MIMVSACEKVTYADFTKSEKEDIIKENVISYVNERKSEPAFANYYFILEQEQKLMPCPNKALKSLRVYEQDSTFAELSIYTTSVNDYLRADSELGEISTYGIQFLVNDSTGGVEKVTPYISFTRYAPGKPGARESLGSEFLKYSTRSVPDVQAVYGSEELMAELDHFYQTEMRQKQEEFVEKCK
jgi:hypothetical protein